MILNESVGRTITVHVDRILLGASKDLANNGKEEAGILALEVLIGLRDLLIEFLGLVNLEKYTEVLGQFLTVGTMRSDKIQDNA